jgi:hypothetical protein
MVEGILQQPVRWGPPSRLSGLTLGAKMAVFQARRALVDLLEGPDRLAPGAGEFTTLAGESVSPLFSEADPRERALELGKAHNLATAAAALDGLVLPPGSTFSFWRQVGRATRARGYRVGRMLREGCLVPAVGGGLCQLSTALYDAALSAGCRIVERHAHSRVVPGSIAERTGRDATVAWNYVDLRFASDRPNQVRTRRDRRAAGRAALGRRCGAGGNDRSRPGPSPGRRRPQLRQLRRDRLRDARAGP